MICLGCAGEMVPGPACRGGGPLRPPSGCPGEGAQWRHNGLWRTRRPPPPPSCSPPSSRMAMHATTARAARNSSPRQAVRPRIASMSVRKLPRPRGPEAAALLGHRDRVPSVRPGLPASLAGVASLPRALQRRGSRGPVPGRGAHGPPRGSHCGRGGGSRRSRPASPHGVPPARRACPRRSSLPRRRRGRGRGQHLKRAGSFCGMCVSRASLGEPALG